MRTINHLLVGLIGVIFLSGCASLDNRRSSDNSIGYSATVNLLDKNYLSEWKGKPGSFYELVLHYNNSIMKSGLSENCMLVVAAPMDDQIRHTFNLPFVTEYVPKNYEVEMIFHKDGYSCFSELSYLDFLRLVSSTYGMSVLYSNEHIRIGYGFTGDNRIF